MPDVIELPINDELDINGWELRKALRLFRKSNGAVYEWLQSPVVYQADESFLTDIRNEMNTYFSPRAMVHHYLSMAKGVVNNDLDGNEIKLKKYFYVLRPTLACRWIIDRKEVPPMEFGKLRLLLDAGLNEIVDNLLEKKAHADEKSTVKCVPELHQWLVNQIDFCKDHVPEPSLSTDSEALNNIFKKYTP